MTLYEHQLTGASWLSNRPTGRGFLGDVPGTGKTRTAITALVKAGSNRALVVCPAIVRTHWAREFAATILNPEAAVIKSYDEIVRGGNALMKTLIRDEGIDSLVTDEHHRLKHFTSKRTMQLLGPDGYARRLEHVFPLSGTPVPKNPVELWTTLSSLFPEVALEHGLKTRQDMVDRFAVTRGGFVRGQWREKILATVRNADEFKVILDKIMLRRTLDDVGLDVPQIFWQTVRLDARELLSTSDSVHAKVMLDDGADLEEIAKDPHVARMRRRLGELKVKPVVEMLTTQLEESDEKVVVFAHHINVIDGLVAGLPDFLPQVIVGDTSPRARDHMINRFRDDPKARVFIGQNIACMEGMDGLQGAARRCVLVEPDWTADVNLQLGKRIARIGQRAERCVGQMIALAGTLDEAIVGQNLQEVRMADSIGLGEK